MRSYSRPSLCGIMQSLVLIVGVAPALASQVHLAWDAPDASTPPAGYLLYAWQEPTEGPQSVRVGLQTTYILSGLEDGATYVFAVTAYDAEGNESDYSNMVTVTIPGGPTLVSPPPAAQLPGPTVLFAWTDGGTAVAEWWIYIGTEVGANDLLDSGSLGEAQSLTVDGLPTDNETIFVRLWYRVDGDWQCRDFPYAVALTP
jgi:hypothetical protein